VGWGGVGWGRVGWGDLSCLAPSEKGKRRLENTHVGKKNALMFTPPTVSDKDNLGFQNLRQKTT